MIVNAFYLMPVLQVLNEVDKLTILLTLIRIPVWQMLAEGSFNLKSLYVAFRMCETITTRVTELFSDISNSEA